MSELLVHGQMRIIVDGLGDYRLQRYAKKFPADSRAKSGWQEVYTNKSIEKVLAARDRCIAKRDKPELMEQTEIVWSE